MDVCVCDCVWLCIEMENKETVTEQMFFFLFPLLYLPSLWSTDHFPQYEFAVSCYIYINAPTFPPSYLGFETRSET